MLPKKQHRKLLCLLLAVGMISGCKGPHTERVTGSAAVRDSALVTDSANGTTSVEETVRPEHEEIRYYIDRLPDRDFVETYGDADNPRPWFSAAEALGQIGKPAIPALVERLDSPDSYELMLALYALMLASQDSALRAEINGDYLRLDTVLTPETNDENRRRALDWWRRYQQLWP